jgi:uncharacterized protein (DUF427 family)
MSTVLREVLLGGLGELRHEPTAKRIRASLAGRTVVDSTAAVLLWEPRRVVASWAVPVTDVAAELVASSSASPSADGVGHAMPEVSRWPILDPSIPFGVHTAAGQVVDLVSAGVTRPAAGLLLADAELDGYVVLDFDAFDEWWEEDERNVGHPREPFHRIDVLSSSRHVRLERDGTVLAESNRPRLLFETLLPMRFYLPREDVHVELLQSATQTTCAYKGFASYFSPVVNGRAVPDLAWSYEQPLPEAARVAGLVCFFDEHLDVVLDGVPRERPQTPWSERG